MTSKTTNKFAPEVHERAVRMVFDHERYYPFSWAAVMLIATTIASDVPRQVLGDDLRLRQILLNLIGNAVKFTERGAINIIATVVSEDQGDMLQVAVSDTGIGIAPDRQNDIFRQFVQADETTARRYGGSGLGLAISAELVRLMAGTMTLASAPGIGTTVRFRIPLIAGAAIEADTSAVLLPDLVASASRTEPGACRLLVAEDHPVNQQLIRAMLARLSIIPDIVADGDAAARRALAAAASDDPYDLVLMDIQMPVRDGIDATRAIRAGGVDAAALPIVALTANAYAVDVEQFLAAGMQDHLPKPITLAALSATIRRWSRPSLPMTAPHGAPTGVHA